MSELDRLAQDAWAHVVRAAGLPDTGWTFTRLSRRDDPHIASLTQLARHPDAGAFTYKFQLRPHAPDGFAHHFELQQRAFDAFPHSKELTTPKPMFLDAERGVSLMQYVEGQPVSDAIKDAANAPSQQRDLLRRCGVWLDAFHRSQEVDTRKFRPARIVQSHEAQRDAILAGDMSVAAQPLYLKGIRKLAEIAPKYAGAPTVGAVQHGDFHLRNLIIGDGQLAGIDFTKGNTAPVGYDIAKILLDFTALFRDPTDLKPGQIIHDATLDAFFDGYTLVGRDDPSVAFLLYVRILSTLLTVPAKKWQRTDAKLRTLNRLRPIARHAFRPGMLDGAKNSNKTIRFLLTRNSLEAARAGTHVFVNALRPIAEQAGFRVALGRNTAHNRRDMDPSDLAIVHMSDPVGADGLVFRKAYAEPFWHVENRAARWDWRIAKRAFDPGTVDAGKAADFFEHWRSALHPKSASRSDAGFVYMPLQGKLLRQRSFQRASPIDMIKTTLAQTDLPIRATLHPAETYAEDELDALRALTRAEPRFTVDDLPMQDALASCRFVVTQNSSAAFHAMFYEKPSVLFAGIDFHHACFTCDPGAPMAAFKAALDKPVPFARFIYWYWALNCINLDADNAASDLRDRLIALGWPMDAKP